MTGERNEKGKHRKRDADEEVDDDGAKVDNAKDQTDEEENHEDADPDDGDDGTGGASKRRRKRKRKRKTSSKEDDDGNDNEEAGENMNDDNKDISYAVEHTVFVEGIPFDATPEDVKTFFIQNGIDDVIELRLPTWQDSGRLRGYGHIKLGSTQSYDVALKEVNGKYMGKRYLNIQPANAPSSKLTQSVTTTSSSSSQPDCKVLFLANLPYSATEADIISAIKKAAPRVSLPVDEDGDTSRCVRIAKNSVTRQSKGFGYLDLSSQDDARQIMQAASKHPIKVGGRVVRLDYDTDGRIKGSYRADSGRLWSKEVQDRERGRNNHPSSGGKSRR